MSVAFAEIQPVLNLVRANDLLFVLGVTQPERRVDVALAFAGLTIVQWSEAAGLGHVQVGRWLERQHRMPLGAAFRLAKVLGVETDVLFAWWME